MVECYNCRVSTIYYVLDYCSCLLDCVLMLVENKAINMNVQLFTESYSTRLLHILLQMCQCLCGDFIAFKLGIVA